MKKNFIQITNYFFFNFVSYIYNYFIYYWYDNKFNNLISNKINQTNNNINLKLNSIKFKVDIEEFSLFLETKNPTVFYRDSIPAKI